MSKKDREPRTARQLGIMVAQFKKATRNPSEWIKFSMREDRPWVWDIELSGFSGDNNEFAGGKYLVKMKAPREFPFKPPRFRFLTHNGVYDIGKKVCVSIGQYHSDQYRAALGMDGFANQLVSGMIGWVSLGTGISIINTSVEKKKEFAAKSLDYNIKNHLDIVTKINNSYLEYSSKFPK